MTDQAEGAKAFLKRNPTSPVAGLTRYLFPELATVPSKVPTHNHPGGKRQQRRELQARMAAKASTR